MKELWTEMYFWAKNGLNSAATDLALCLLVEAENQHATGDCIKIQLNCRVTFADKFAV